MSPSHRHLTAQNLAYFMDFFLDLYMQAGKFMIFFVFYELFVHYFFAHFPFKHSEEGEEEE